MNLSGNDKNKITGKKYQPVMSITGLNDQGLKWTAGQTIVQSLEKPNIEASSKLHTHKLGSTQL